MNGKQADTYYSAFNHTMTNSVLNNGLDLVNPGKSFLDIFTTTIVLGNCFDLGPMRAQNGTDSRDFNSCDLDIKK